MTQYPHQNQPPQQPRPTLPPYQLGPYGATTTAAPKKKRPWLVPLVAALAGVMVGMGIGGAGKSGTATEAVPASTVTTTVKETAARTGRPLSQQWPP